MSAADMDRALTSGMLVRAMANCLRDRGTDLELYEACALALMDGGFLAAEIVAHCEAARSLAKAMRT